MGQSCSLTMPYTSADARAIKKAWAARPELSLDEVVEVFDEYKAPKQVAVEPPSERHWAVEGAFETARDIAGPIGSAAAGLAAAPIRAAATLAKPLAVAGGMDPNTANFLASQAERAPSLLVERAGLGVRGPVGQEVRQRVQAMPELARGVLEMAPIRGLGEAAGAVGKAFRERGPLAGAGEVLRQAESPFAVAGAALDVPTAAGGQSVRRAFGEPKPAGPEDLFRAAMTLANVGLTIPAISKALGVLPEAVHRILTPTFAASLTKSAAEQAGTMAGQPEPILVEQAADLAATGGLAALAGAGTAARPIQARRAEATRAAREDFFEKHRKFREERARTEEEIRAEETAKQEAEAAADQEAASRARAESDAKAEAYERERSEREAADRAERKARFDEEARQAYEREAAEREKARARFDEEARKGAKDRRSKGRVDEAASKSKKVAEDLLAGREPVFESEAESGRVYTEMLVELERKRKIAQRLKTPFSESDAKLRDILIQRRIQHDRKVTPEPPKETLKERLARKRAEKDASAKVQFEAEEAIQAQRARETAEAAARPPVPEPERSVEPSAFADDGVSGPVSQALDDTAGRFHAGDSLGGVTEAPGTRREPSGRDKGPAPPPTAAPPPEAGELLDETDVQRRAKGASGIANYLLDQERKGKIARQAVPRKAAFEVKDTTAAPEAEPVERGVTPEAALAAAVTWRQTAKQLGKSKQRASKREPDPLLRRQKLLRDRLEATKVLEEYEKKQGVKEDMDLETSIIGRLNKVMPELQEQVARLYGEGHEVDARELISSTVETLKTVKSETPEEGLALEAMWRMVQGWSREKTTGPEQVPRSPKQAAKSREGAIAFKTAPAAGPKQAVRPASRPMVSRAKGKVKVVTVGADKYRVRGHYPLDAIPHRRKPFDVLVLKEKGPAGRTFLATRWLIDEARKARSIDGLFTEETPEYLRKIGMTTKEGGWLLSASLGAIAGARISPEPVAGTVGGAALGALAGSLGRALVKGVRPSLAWMQQGSEWAYKELAMPLKHAILLRNRFKRPFEERYAAIRRTLTDEEVDRIARFDLTAAWNRAHGLPLAPMTVREAAANDLFHREVWDKLLAIGQRELGFSGSIEDYLPQMAIGDWDDARMLQRPRKGKGGPFFTKQRKLAPFARAQITDMDELFSRYLSMLANAIHLKKPLEIVKARMGAVLPTQAAFYRDVLSDVLDVRSSAELEAIRQHAVATVAANIGTNVSYATVLGSPLTHALKSLPLPKVLDRGARIASKGLPLGNVGSILQNLSQLVYHAALEGPVQSARDLARVARSPFSVRKDALDLGFITSRILDVIRDESTFRQMSRKGLSPWQVRAAKVERFVGRQVEKGMADFTSEEEFMRSLGVHRVKWAYETSKKIGSVEELVRHFDFTRFHRGVQEALIDLWEEKKHGDFAVEYAHTINNLAFFDYSLASQSQAVRGLREWYPPASRVFSQFGRFGVQQLLEFLPSVLRVPGWNWRDRMSERTRAAYRSGGLRRFPVAASLLDDLLDVTRRGKKAALYGGLLLSGLWSFATAIRFSTNADIGNSIDIDPKDLLKYRGGVMGPLLFSLLYTSRKLLDPDGGRAMDEMLTAAGRAVETQFMPAGLKDLIELTSAVYSGRYDAMPAGKKAEVARLYDRLPAEHQKVAREVLGSSFRLRAGRPIIHKSAAGNPLYYKSFRDLVYKTYRLTNEAQAWDQFALEYLKSAETIARLEKKSKTKEGLSIGEHGTLLVQRALQRKRAVTAPLERFRREEAR